MKRSARLLATTSALTLGLLGAGALSPSAAHADVTRCVGAVDVPQAYACWTSPRFDHIGFQRTSVTPIPVVCFGIGCTDATLVVWTPAEQVGGRFTSVTYLGKTWTVYRPADGQEYVVTSDWGPTQPVQDVEKLLVAVALDAAGQ